MPRLSLCIPTWDRAQLLDHTIGRLIDAYGDDIELSIADNSSTDNTEQVVRHWMAEFPHVRYIKHKKVKPCLGQWIAMRNATCPLVAFMADDDWILPNVWDYVGRMESNHELAANYTDLIAWDDENEREIHRYFHLPKAFEFSPQQSPIDLLNFVFHHIIYPEIGIFRRDAFFRSDVLVERGNLPNLLWMYRMSRLGSVRFEAAQDAYYQENRVVKQRFQRTPTSNLVGRMGYIGDEYRNILETLVLWAFRDSGHASIPDDAQITIRRMIDRFLVGRVPLEISRARNEGNGILASELRNRFMLWGWDGVWPSQRIADTQAIVQAIVEACGHLGLTSVRLVGDAFHLGGLIREANPELRLVNDAGDGVMTVFPKDDGQSVLGGCMFIDRLAEQYYA